MKKKQKEKGSAVVARSLKKAGEGAQKANPFNIGEAFASFVIGKTSGKK